FRMVIIILAIQVSLLFQQKVSNVHFFPNRAFMELLNYRNSIQQPSISFKENLHRTFLVTTVKKQPQVKRSQYEKKFASNSDFSE
ncbi:hypothetical protein DND62_31475, partial [Pseudomonas syringae pv. pisi]